MTHKHRDKKQEQRQDLNAPETRGRSGNREGDYAPYLDAPATRKRSGKREGDYAAYFDEPSKNSKVPDAVIFHTRERSGNREGDYAPFLEKSSTKEELMKKFRDCCTALRTAGKLKKGLEEKCTPSTATDTPTDTPNPPSSIDTPKHP